MNTEERLAIVRSLIGCIPDIEVQTEIDEEIEGESHMQKLRQATSQEVYAYADYVRKLEDYETLWDWVDQFQDSETRRYVKVRFEVEVNNDDEERVYFGAATLIDQDGNEAEVDDDTENPELSDDGMRDAQMHPDGTGGTVYERDDVPQLGKIKPLWIIEDDKSA